MANKLKLPAKRWKAVTGEIFANAIFSVVRGNCRRLEEAYDSKQSVWGEIVLKFGPEFENKVDRYWAYLAFKRNDMKVKDMHQELCRQAKCLYLPVLGVLSLSTARNAGDVHCVCAKQYDVDEDETMVQCDGCDVWYHAICCSINIPFYTKRRRYKCEKCKGNTTIEIVPPLFQAAYRNPVTEIPQSPPPPLHTSTPISKRAEKPATTVTARKISMSGQQHGNTEEKSSSDDSMLKYPPTKKMKPTSADRSDKKETRPSRLPEDAPQSLTEKLDSCKKSVSEKSLSTAESQDASESDLSESTSDDKAQLFSDVSPERKTTIASPCKSKATLRKVSEQDTDNKLSDPPIEHRAGPLRIAESFKMKLPWTDWQRIVPQYHPENASKQYKWRMPMKFWPGIFNKHFLEAAPKVMKGCVLSFDHHYVYPLNDSNYISAHAKCTRTAMTKRKGKSMETVGRDIGNKCSMTYTFTMDKPGNGESNSEDDLNSADEVSQGGNVTVSIRANGVLDHDITKSSSRHLSGYAREEAKKVLQKTRARKYRRELFASDNINKAALDQMNFFEVQSLDVFRVARKEAMDEEDESHDPVWDLIRRREKMRLLVHLQGKTVQGYIQGLSLYPFKVIMFTERQLNLLRRLLRLYPNSTLHLDASGGLTKKLLKELGSKRQFYYALVVRLPGKEAPIVPILEFILNAHDAVEIAYCLALFFRSYREYTGSNHRCCDVKRVETDDSPAMISAVMSAMRCGPTFVYLRQAWEYLRTGLDIHKPEYCHHICRTHAVAFISTRIETVFPKLPDVVAVLKSWMNAFIRGRDLHSFCRRVKDILHLCGSKYLTKDVQNIIHRMNTQTDRAGQPWNIVSLKNVPLAGPLYQQSPFSYFAIQQCEQLHVCWKEKQTPYPEDSSVKYVVDKTGARHLNDFYCVPFLEYLIRYVFPYSPLFNRSLMYAMGLSFSDDTQAASESWNKIAKIDELAGLIPNKVGRVVTKLENVINGGVEMFSLALTSIERKGKKMDDVIKTEIKPNPVDKKPTKQKKLPVVKQAAVDLNISAPITLKDSSKRASDDEKLKIPSPATAKDSKKRTAPQKASKAPEDRSEGWRPRKGIAPQRSVDKTPLHSLTRPFWGGDILFNDELVRLANTCSIDNQIYIFYTMCHLYNDAKEYVERFRMIGDRAAKILLNIVRALDAGDVNKAKGLTVMDLLNMSPAILETGNLWGTEEEFLSSLKCFNRVQQVTECTNKDCKFPKLRDIYPTCDWMFKTPGDMEFRYNVTRNRGLCADPLCKTPNVMVHHEFPMNLAPAFLVFNIPNVPKSPFVETSIPQQLNVLGHQYNLHAYSVYTGSNHFHTIIVYNGKKYKYDGLNPEFLMEYKAAGPLHQISTVWMVKARDRVVN